MNTSIYDLSPMHDLDPSLKVEKVFEIGNRKSHAMLANF
jgi:hypothetical protein